jgi:DNA adenine methylase
MSARKVEKVIEPIEGKFEDIAANLVCGEPQGVFINMPQNYPHSPLRYPGGKNRAVKAILPCIPTGETELCSPFLGGGSIELACSTRMNVHGADIFSPLVDFWQALLNDKDRLIKRVEAYLPITRTEFYNLQQRYMNLEDKIERAAAFFVLNRSSFSGTTLSGGMSPGHPRFTESAIQRLRDFDATNFQVECADFRDTIAKYPNAFLYLDPPYLNGEALYGLKGDTHKDFDHLALAELLLNRERWIMSYNDCPVIRNLYRNNTILDIDWVYGMSKDKTSKEVLVLSRDLE